MLRELTWPAVHPQPGVLTRLKSSAGRRSRPVLRSRAFISFCAAYAAEAPKKGVASEQAAELPREHAPLRSSWSTPKPYAATLSPYSGAQPASTAAAADTAPSCSPAVPGSVPARALDAAEHIDMPAEWLEGDGMAAGLNDSGAVATQPPARSSRLPYFIASPLRHLLGLGGGSSAADSSSSSDAAAAEGEEGAASTGPPAAQPLVGYLEGRPGSFERSLSAKVLDAVAEGDGMGAVHQAEQRDAGAAAAASAEAQAAHDAAAAALRTLPPNAKVPRQQESFEGGAAMPLTAADMLHNPWLAALPVSNGRTAEELGRTSCAAAAPQPPLQSPPPQARGAGSGGEGGGPAQETHVVLRLLRQRVAEGSAPDARADGYKLGLVLEGGGMRGIVNGGALQALHDLGLRDAFDAVYGASAGALNATYFLAGQREGVHAYHDHIANPEFISLRRLWRGRGEDGAKPVLDLSFLVDRIMHDVHPLDWDRVLASPIALKVVASSLDILRPVALSGFVGKEDLMACLKASANVPEIAGAPILHRGHRLVDAAVFEPIPFRSAIADGCSHVLVLCNRQLAPRDPWSIATHLEEAMEAVVKRAVMSPDYMLPAWEAELENLQRDGMREDDMLLAALQPGAYELPWFRGSHVLPVMPGAAANFSPICINQAALRAGLVEGRRMIAAALKPALEGVLDSDLAGDTAGREGSNIVPFAKACREQALR